jgi:hypothetical protein
VISDPLEDPAQSLAHAWLRKGRNRRLVKQEPTQRPSGDGSARRALQPILDQPMTPARGSKPITARNADLANCANARGLNPTGRCRQGLIRTPWTCARSYRWLGASYQERLKCHS